MMATVYRRDAISQEDAYVIPHFAGMEFAFTEIDAAYVWTQGGFQIARSPHDYPVFIQVHDDALGTGNEAPNKQTPPTDSDRSRQVTFDSDDRIEDDVEQAMFELDLSTSADREKWIPAIREAYRYLSERQEAPPSSAHM